MWKKLQVRVLAGQDRSRFDATYKANELYLPGEIYEEGLD
jgi:hypothetical protein